MITSALRFQKARQLLEEAEAIASQLHVQLIVPEISTRMAAIYERGMSVEYPIKQVDATSARYITLQKIAPKRRSNKLPLCFWPLCQEDAHLGKSFAYHVAQTEFGSYNCGSHCIQINLDADETMRFLACTFLHELGHAWSAIEEGRAGIPMQVRSLEDRLAEEVRMWTAEYKLMIALGGEEFAETISFNAVDMFYALDKQIRIAINLTDAGKILATCLGPPPSARATEGRYKSYLIYCYFYMADHYLKDRCPMKLKMSVLQDSFCQHIQKATAAIKFHEKLS